MVVRLCRHGNRRGHRLDTRAEHPRMSKPANKSTLPPLTTRKVDGFNVSEIRLLKAARRHSGRRQRTSLTSEARPESSDGRSLRKIALRLSGYRQARETA